MRLAPFLGSVEQSFPGSLSCLGPLASNSRPSGSPSAGAMIIQTSPDSHQHDLGLSVAFLRWGSAGALRVDNRITEAYTWRGSWAGHQQFEPGAEHRCFRQMSLTKRISYVNTSRYWTLSGNDTYSSRLVSKQKVNRSCTRSLLLVNILPRW